MTRIPPPPLWWQLTPQQRAMLRRLWRDGPLIAPERREMRTVRSLLARGLLRPRDPGRDRAGPPGTWFLTARAVRLVAAERTCPQPPPSGETEPSGCSVPGMPCAMDDGPSPEAGETIASAARAVSGVD